MGLKEIDERLLRSVFGAELNQANRDAFGRLRVSQVQTLFDSKQLVDAQPLYFDDQQTSGSGATSTYTAAKTASVMAVSNTTAGTRVRQTFRRFNYQPGKSQLAYITFTGQAPQTGITRRVGLFDQNNGLFLEQTSAGMFFVIRNATVDGTRIPQAQWNVDKCDGTGESRVNIDLSKSQILTIDFEWLGVGTVRYGFVVNGTFITAHVQQHSNIVTQVYHANPNLPIRYEISNGGTGPAATLDTICSTVCSEGGVQYNGIERGVDNGTAGFTTLNSANLYPLLGLRLKSTHLMGNADLTEASILCTSTAAYRFVICSRPTLAGTAVTWNDVSNSCLQYSTPGNGTTISAEGTLIHSGYDNAGNSSNSAGISLGGFLGLGSFIDGTPTELWVGAQRLSGTTETFYASVAWRELL
ncbi:MAG: hypothetical protein ACOYB3_01585 [Azonexus sp.]